MRKAVSWNGDEMGYTTMCDTHYLTDGLTFGDSWTMALIIDSRNDAKWNKVARWAMCDDNWTKILSTFILSVRMHFLAMFGLQTDKQINKLKLKLYANLWVRASFIFLLIIWIAKLHKKVEYGGCVGGKID